MNRRFRKTLTITGLAAAAGLLAAECAMIPGQANAQTTGFPTVTSVPGPYYNQGQAINLCVNQRTEQVRVEVHTQQLGNCITGETQLTVTANPSALAIPAPSSSASG